jgi:Zn-dependent M28 family amino/carboxypeptidase
MTENETLDTVTTNLRQHLAVLCDEIGPRSMSQPQALERAARYVEEQFAASGYSVVPQEYTWRGGTFRNLVVELPGEKHPEEIVVIGAHYDTVPQTPGADDNASAVAALLELARLCHDRFGRDLRPARTVRFVAFTLEEPPAFFTPHQGSRVYAQALRQRKERVVAMIALEMLGYYSDEPNSQHFPLLPLRWFYPTTGNFIGVIGNFRSLALTRQVAQAMQTGTDLPVEWLAAPPVIPGLALSDHASFWFHGYRAVMVTDTAFYRNPHYHRPTDRPETLDFERMAQCVPGLEEVVRELGQGARERA